MSMVNYFDCTDVGSPNHYVWCHPRVDGPGLFEKLAETLWHMPLICAQKAEAGDLCVLGQPGLHSEKYNI